MFSFMTHKNQIHESHHKLCNVDVCDQSEDLEVWRNETMTEHEKEGMREEQVVSNNDFQTKCDEIILTTQFER